MKKLYALGLGAALGLASVCEVNAQATRLVLAEQFTQASCGPCASQNPAFNALLSSNSTKVVSIKYQTSWPGFDPMNLQNPTQVQTRVSYYGVSGVPNVQVDGVEVANDCNAFPGAPACLSQAEIDATFNAPTPISVVVSHTMANDLTSATVNVVVSNVGSSDFTFTGNTFLRLALVEAEINFPNPPGSTNEKEFYSVMRRMVPNETGTALPTTLVAGQTVSNSFTVPMPSYIYNYGEIAFVAFVQTDGSKKIHNAAYSSPLPVPSGFADAGIANNSTAGSGLCDPNFTPSFTINNNSATTITSARVNYSINGGAAVSQTYTGSLMQGASAVVTFPTIQLPGGTSNVEAFVDNVNGQQDFNTLNNTITPAQYSVLAATPQAAPYTKDFEPQALGGFPTELILQDNTGRIFVVDRGVSSSITWNMGAFEGSNKSLRVDYYTIADNEVSNIVLEKVSPSGLGAGANLYFDHAYAQYQTENDALDVFVSTDCGVTWTNVWSRAGQALSTAPATTNRFYPRAANWHRQIVSLAPYASATDLVVRFQCTSKFGNSLYLDNISIAGQPVGNDESEVAAVKVYPVPARENVNVELTANGLVKLELVNSLGAVVRKAEFEANGSSTLYNLNTADLAEGVYTLSIETNESRSIRKVSVAK